MGKTLLVLLAVALPVAGYLFWRGHRFRLATRDLQQRLFVGARADERLSLDAELAGLPVPVQQYLRAVLTDGMSLPAGVQLSQQGEFLIRAPDGWTSFTAEQQIATNPPGFVWDARMAMVPGVPVRVRDALVGTQGSMQAAIGGVLPVVDVVGTPDITQGALTRWLAEAPWFPVALLPSRGVSWTAMDAQAARATVTCGSTTVSVEFFFGADGLIERTFCPVRMRDVGGRGVPTPWQGRLRDYQRFGDMLIPAYGEVAWLLPAGEQLYWKGRIVDVQYR
jgi:hypothetical protein